MSDRVDSFIRALVPILKDVADCRDDAAVDEPWTDAELDLWQDSFNGR